MSKFSDRLARTMEITHTSTQKLGDCIDVSGTAIWNYSTGKQIPSIEIFQKIAKYFSVSYSFLLGDDSEESKYVEKLETENASLKEKLKRINALSCEMEE